MIDWLFDFFGFLFVCAILAFLFIHFSGGLPLGLAKTFAVGLQISAFGIIDVSFVFFIIVALLIDSVVSWLHPSKELAVINLIGIFALGFLNLALNSGFVPVFSALSSNTLLPLTTSFVVGNDKVFVLLFFMVLSVIFNLRGDKK